VQRVVTGANHEIPASAGVDPHVIAQQVYRILKQRLMLERERAGIARSRYA
jgi:hypothetical protein